MTIAARRPQLKKKNAASAPTWKMTMIQSVNQLAR
jgi:hypothetical protein